MIRVVLPAHLRTLAGVTGEIELSAIPPITAAAVIDALEKAYPALHGTVRDPSTGARRPFVRFFACEEDLSHAPPGAPLPEPVLAGTEPFIILGAMAGG
jgi:sulfur-carrier protein